MYNSRGHTWSLRQWGSELKSNTKQLHTSKNLQLLLLQELQLSIPGEQTFELSKNEMNNEYVEVMVEYCAGSQKYIK